MTSTHVSVSLASVLFFVACNEYEISSSVDAEQNAVEEEDDVVVTEDTDVEPEVPQPEAPVYAHTFDQLWEVEPNTGATTLVGSFHDAAGQPVENFVDIAINIDGVVYGGTYEALYRINPETAEVQYVCSPDTMMTALAFSSDGVLFAGGAEGINRVDVATCSVEPWVYNSYETSGDLVGLPDGYLYWTVRGEWGDQLVRVNPNDGGTRWIGEIGYEKLYGLGYDDDQLYGFTSDGLIVRVSPESAGGYIVANDEDRSWWGATTNPVVWE